MSRRFSQPWIVLALGAWALIWALDGCQAILDLDPGHLRTTATGGAGAAAGGGGAAATGGAGGHGAGPDCPPTAGAGPLLDQALFGGPDLDLVHGAEYGDGRIALAAQFERTASFGAGVALPLGAKMNRDGLVAWYRDDGLATIGYVRAADGAGGGGGAGGAPPNTQEIWDVAMDGSDIVMVGRFRHSAAVGDFDLLATSGDNRWSSFVARASATADVAWAVTLSGGDGTGGGGAGQAGEVKVSAVAVDDRGTAWVAGQLSGALMVEGVRITPQAAGPHVNDAFIVAISREGEVRTHDVYSSPDEKASWATDIAHIPGEGETDPGALLVGGAFDESIVFPDLGEQEAVDGDNSWLIRRPIVDSDTIVPLYLSEYQGEDKVRAVAVDGQGNAFVAGVFVGAHGLVIGGRAVTGVAADLPNAYVAKFDGPDSATWAGAPATAETDSGDTVELWSLAVDPQGAIICGGGFRGSAQFGDALLTSPGSGLRYAAFVTKLVPVPVDSYDHGWTWRIQTGGGSAITTAVSADECGNVAVLGHGSGEEVLNIWRGGTLDPVASLGEVAVADVFLLRLGP